LPVVRTKSKFIEYAEAIIIAILIAFFIRTFIVQAFKIPSGSMKPTLLIGDHLLVNKFIYGVKIPYVRKTLISISEPKRGDVVVFIYPEDRSKDFIKRVIGVGGDTIEIRNKNIFLNGLPYQDTHGVYSDDFVIPGSIQPRDNFGPFKVPEGTLFTMGDNRDQSYDSRFWGVVDMKDVLGKAMIIYWSWNKEESNLRWNRLLKLLHP
jgi:signal peptidase I